MQAIMKMLALASCAALLCLALSGCSVVDEANGTLDDLDQAREDVDQALSDVSKEMGSAFADVQSDLAEAFSNLQDSANNLSAASLLGKASRIEMTDARTGEVIAVHDDEAAIEEFASNLDLASWQPIEKPAGATKEFVATLQGRETVKLGQTARDARMTTLCALTTYENLDTITLDAGALSLSFSGPAADLQAFRDLV